MAEVRGNPELTPEGLVEGMRSMADLCGLRSDFLLDLIGREPNDWSFVIKAHALLESIVCQRLALYLRQPAMEFVLAQKVQMEDRIEMLKALGIAESSERQMMRTLGRLRNNLVHNVQQTDFTFVHYLQKRDNRRNFADSFGTSWADPVPNTQPPVRRAEYTLANPRFAIFSDLVHSISLTLNEKAEALRDERRASERQALREATLEKLRTEVDAGTGPGDENSQ